VRYTDEILPPYKRPGFCARPITVPRILDTVPEEPHIAHTMNKAIRRRQYDLSNQSDLGSVRRLVVALLGLFVVTFNVVGALPAQAEGTNPLFTQALMDDRIVICTATGLVVMDKDGNIVDATGDGHNDFCVFCLPLMHGGAKAPALVALDVQASYTAFAGEVPAFIPPAAKPARLDGASSPRAPPRA